MELDRVLIRHPIECGVVDITSSYVSANAGLDLDILTIYDLENTGLYGDEVHEALKALTPEAIRALDYEYCINWGDCGAYVGTIETGDFTIEVGLLISSEEDE